MQALYAFLLLGAAVVAACVAASLVITPLVWRRARKEQSTGLQTKPPSDTE